MAKKKDSRGPGLPVRIDEPATSSKRPLLLGVGVLLVAGAAFFMWSKGASTPTATDAHGGGSHGSASSGAEAGTDRVATNAAAKAAVGPHKQATYPPIPFQGYDPPRSKEVITAAYQFAAEHPEVLSYVPCFCGCERQGHEGNTDCFVKSRAENGDVITWDEHGVECAVCIDVANRSRQMHSAGASVRDIRAAIDKEFGTLYPGKMPTPHPPAKSAQH